MNTDLILIFTILGATMLLFLWGRWRHDVVALAALLACVLTGLVSSKAAFSGFGHPAVVTVACVLVLSRALQKTGAVDSLAHFILPKQASFNTTMIALVALGALLSAFMNNVGAMALLMPLAIQTAEKNEIPAGKLLMPLAFGTILGGMTTLIGTPPNLIVAGFRAETEGRGFAMFDFSPVGLSVAIVGIAFLVLLGRYIVPTRTGSRKDQFDTGVYLTETQVTDQSKANGMTLRDAEQALEEADAQIVSLFRNSTQISVQNRLWKLRTGDILVIEAEPDSFSTVLSSLGLIVHEIEPDENPADEPKPKKSEADDSEEVLKELIPLPQARLRGRSADRVRLRSRYGLSLLAISRQGQHIVKRLQATAIRAGDVLLLKGSADGLAEFASDYGCVPIAPRSINMPNKRHAILASLIMILAVAAAAFGWLSADIAFALAVLLYVLMKIISPGEAYEAIDWSIIILLGALIPVANAMASTGAADWLAQGLLESVARGHPVVALALVLIVTMTLSDFMNNAATAAVMCPLALSTATQLNAQPDAFLMAVAIGASCAFLTPIGHQNNTLILGPGGFRFGDYWRLGLPMELIVVSVSLPVLLWIWPL